MAITSNKQIVPIEVLSWAGAKESAVLPWSQGSDVKWGKIISLKFNKLHNHGKALPASHIST